MNESLYIKEVGPPGHDPGTPLIMSRIKEITLILFPSEQNAAYTIAKDFKIGFESTLSF